MTDEESLSREHITVLVFAILKDAKTHGWQIMQEVERRSGHHIKIRRVTLYLVLRDLEREGMIASTWDHTERPRRVYELTEQGLQECERQLKKWDRFAKAMYRVTGASADERPA